MTRYTLLTGIACTFILLWTVADSLADSDKKTIEVEHVYQLGDSDSRSEAVRLCYAEAERRALEQAGVYMESRTEISNFALKKDEVYSFTAAVLQVERLGEEVRLDGQHMSVYCKSRVTFNEQEVLDSLAYIARNPALRNELGESGREVESARRKVTESASPPEPAPPADGSEMRAPVTPVPPIGPDNSTRLSRSAEQEKALDSLESIKRKRDDIVRRNRQLTEAGRVAVVRGMTPGEVREMLGNPQARRTAERGGYAYVCERYGSLWVVFRDEAALCLRKQLEQRAAEGLCHCAGSADSFVWR
ncbi:MAG: hypothetical protein ACK5JO_05200 [Halodesulfovibrio sp.]